MIYMEMRKEILDLNLAAILEVRVDILISQGAVLDRGALSHSPFPLAALVIQILLDLVWMIFLAAFLVVVGDNLVVLAVQLVPNLGPRVPPKFLEP